jgi:hypothetical protein
VSTEPKPDDVTGMGAGLMKNPAIAIFFGAAAAFGGGAIGAQGRGARKPEKRLSNRMQALVFLGVYGPLLLLPLVLWILTRDWARTLLISGIVWVVLFFGVGFAAVVLGYRRAGHSRID